MLSAESIPDFKSSGERYDAILPEGSYKCELADIKFKLTEPHPKAIAEGKLDKVPTFIFQFVTLDLDTPAEISAFVNMAWGQKAKLPSFLTAIDPDGFTTEVAKNCGRSKEYLVAYVNSLVGRYYKVKSKPSSSGKSNKFVTCFPVDGGVVNPAPKFGAPTTTRTDSQATGFESMPDVNDDDTPF